MLLTSFNLCKEDTVCPMRCLPGAVSSLTPSLHAIIVTIMNVRGLTSHWLLAVSRESSYFSSMIGGGSIGFRFLGLFSWTTCARAGCCRTTRRTPLRAIILGSRTTQICAGDFREQLQGRMDESLEIYPWNRLDGRFLNEQNASGARGQMYMWSRQEEMVIVAS